MVKDVLSVRQLGEKVCWTLVQQAIGIKDSLMHSDFMTEKVCILFFAQHSLPERLCVSAAVRQLGGSIVYESDPTGDSWLHELHEFQLHLLPIFNFYVNCAYLYGIPLTTFKGQEIDLDFPTVNAGSPDAHPAHALADIAYMIKQNRYLNTTPCAWIGKPNGTLHSLVCAARWFPFSLRIAVPEGSDIATLKEEIGESHNCVLVDSISEAVKNVKYIFIGSRIGMGYPLIKDWEIEKDRLAGADPNAEFFLAARPVNSLPISKELLSSKASLLLKQSEYRLRIHKRILHYIFSE